ncbi:hypothetical protein FV226_13810 [Methylobacterium sp. WL12]|nr:hypothetical protein FV226_13810 [Methylobacterium sp. WL12]TXM81376.1 hypothetical protein FV219_27855 [Methylobacterium sp. WL122]TXN84581.1 hypothetical protein FV234_01590 [Methylobacterium sp. WL8]
MKRGLSAASPVSILGRGGRPPQPCRSHAGPLSRAGEGQGEGREPSGEVTPLTPTLSPWEREPRGASSDPSGTVARRCVKHRGPKASNKAARRAVYASTRTG